VDVSTKSRTMFKGTYEGMINELRKSLTGRDGSASWFSSPCGGGDMAGEGRGEVRCFASLLLLNEFEVKLNFKIE
jgi:hypothetical protein